VPITFSIMDARQHLFYGLGQIAYAIAISDGKIQKEEEERLMDMVMNGIGKLGADVSYTEIIFKIHDKDKTSDGDFLYKEGIKNLDLGKHHFTAEMQEGFFALLEEVAGAHNNVSQGERRLLNAFKTDITNLMRPH
jgi:hypothetical protein